MSFEAGKFYTNYSFEYPNEALNTNVKNVSVATSSFQDVPSNKKNLINITMNGILRPSEKLHVIKMIFKGDIPNKNTLAQPYGTFVLCKDVYNAKKIIKRIWDKETSTLTITIDLSKYNVRPKRRAQFSFSIQINDICQNVGACTFNSSGQDTYYITCKCPYYDFLGIKLGTRIGDNTWLKEALCDKNASFENNKGALVVPAATKAGNLPAGSWVETCRIGKKIVKKKENGTEYNARLVYCISKKLTCTVLQSNEAPWGWKTNTVSKESFYANSWQNNSGQLNKG
jgi:hypothetical protein